MELIQRFALAELEEWTRSFRVVVVNGPRQAGKSTLLRQFEQEHGGSYISLDEPDQLQGALLDPAGFARFGNSPFIIDEVQRAGDALIRAIKRVVDVESRAGQFVLSGSTKFLTVPTLSESLAGRTVFVELWPLAVAERLIGQRSFVDRAFTDPRDLAGQQLPLSREGLLKIVCETGYPEALELPTAKTKSAWFSSYLQTVISRDIAEFAEITQREVLPKLLRMVAARAGSPMVIADLARSVGVSATTIRNYISYLEIVFLVATVPSWSDNANNRVVKAPKAFVSDAGLTAHLLGVDAAALRWPGHRALGGMVETFVHSELLKLRTFAQLDVDIFHFRDRDSREIDFILEARDGRIVAIEVKASSSITAHDARHLTWLRDKVGDRFVGGIVLHLGGLSGPFGDRITALPISALWS